MNFRIIFLFLLLVSAVPVSAQVSTSISELERQKVQAVEEGNFKLAAELKQKITALREKEAAEQIRKAEEAKKGAESGFEANKEIEILEQQKKEAVNNQDFILANQLLIKIKALKEKQAASTSATSASNTPKTGTENAIQFLEKEKVEAVADANYKLAAEISAKIKELKAGGTGNVTPISTNNDLAAKIKELENEKAKAVSDANYKLAGEINAKIKELKTNPTQSIASGTNNNSQLAAQIKALEDEKAKAVAAADYKLAGELNNKIKNLKNPEATQNFATQSGFNAANYSAVPSNTGVKISKSGENEQAGIKYRRSSLYTIMRNDAAAQYASVIEGAFVSSEVPGKFNNHNLEARIIRPGEDLTGEVAKRMIATWFNRDYMGRFNMNLIEQRGLYNASNIDFNIAQGAQRGRALLADAGEELIGNTFVIINEFKYVDKEEVAGNTSKALKVGGFIAGFIPGGGAIKTATTIAATAVTIAGKGYWVKNTSHLYKLAWNAQIADEFYNNYWIDENNYDENKKRAFDGSNLFRLDYIGFEIANAGTQSTAFTSKSDEELIARATVKAVDAGIAKLERKYEQFRTKTPLYSVDPLTAKIGKKEGLEAGDKFEVLEQVQDVNGKIQYVRKGIIYVDGKNIWDNTYTIEELQELQAAGKQLDQNQFTVFRGGSAGFAPGMLIRQIN